MSKTILIIDDDSSITAILSFILSEAEFNVQITASGKEALEIITSPNNIDLIFLDLSIPLFSGQTILHQIIKLKPNLPVIIMTGDLDEKRLKEIYSIGAIGIIYKPFDVEEILLILKQYLKKNNIKNE